MNYLKKEHLPIITPHLVLRLVEVYEADWMVRYVTDNRLHLEPWEPTRSDAYYTTDYWKKELMHRQNEFYLGEALNLAVFLKDPRSEPSDPIIGVCNFTNFMYGVFQSCFLGYSMHHRYQGQGVMKEALDAAIDFVFKTFNLHRIMANYMPRNERSGRLLKKLGFTVEGYARDYLKIADQWEDHILTSKITSKISNQEFK
ncbi:MAG: GNAT family N-acetyltransferase [Candidatus Omnitrophota bacterium]